MEIRIIGPEKLFFSGRKILDPTNMLNDMFFFPDINPTAKLLFWPAYCHFCTIFVYIHKNKIVIKQIQTVSIFAISVKASLKRSKMARNLIAIIAFALIVSSNAISQILPGAYQTHEYLPLIENKNVGIVANQSSLIGQTHLVDSLLSLNISIAKVFAPEHGFRGKAEAGAKIEDGKDVKTGLEIISLYGKNKKPKAEQLEGLDIIIFDLQGVGARFYTYISTLKYVMEACGENHIPLIVLDRPNPHIHYIDGPVLKKEFQSFVGALPIPIVYGLSDGELAQMINGEKWIDSYCDLTVIPIKNYTRNSVYELPVKPSPNLPNFNAVYLYPSLCLFEGTPISIGRGTDFPFEVIGYPECYYGSFIFTPRAIPGVSENPKFKGQNCFGTGLIHFYKTIEDKPNELNLSWIWNYYKNYPHDKKQSFFNSFFDKLAGTDQLRKQIESGMSIEEIRNSWQNDLIEFDRKRQKYLIYPIE